MNDLISRQAAIDALTELREKTIASESFRLGIYRSMEEIKNVPSAQPERKKGMWIKLDMHAHIADHKCTACGQECYVPTCMGEPMYAYCPNCGARMDEE